ncbi:MAG: hypothetical protein JEZ07_14650 [Phycisphaerae bacterium]|nr:hypothetical protein [Phycisphaerae bacterium]
MPAKKWLDILCWDKLPAFGDIHRLDENTFTTLYYSDHHKIQHMAACLMSGLKGDFPPNNCRVIGFPGVGKTTFLYYLKASIKKEKEKDNSVKCFLKILDCVDLIKDETINEVLLFDKLFDATMDYFNYFDLAIANEVVKGIIQNNEINNCEKCYHLWDFYKKNLILFPHRLFLALDGIDTIPEDCMVPLAVKIYNVLPTRYVRLWLSIRNIRYENLSETIRSQLDTLFQEPHKFPPIELKGIIDERIKNIESSEGAGKCPFSDKLCSFLINFYNGDLRRSLAMMNRILQEVSPKGLEGRNATSELFIQKYIEREGIRVLFSCDELCNLYDVTQTAFRIFPLEKEVLMALSAHPRIDFLLSSVLQDEIKTKLSTEAMKFPISDLFNNESLQAALAFLKTRNLIEILSENQIIITQRGWEVQKIAETEYYITLCKNAIKDTGSLQNTSRTYWKIAAIQSPYQELVVEKMIGTE